MNKLGLILFGGLLVAVTGHAQEESAGQAAEKLEHAVAHTDSAGPRQLPPEEWARVFLALRAAALRRDTANARTTINTIQAMETSSAVRELCRTFLNDVQKERSARNEAFSHRVDLAIRKAQGACQTAETESGLNPLLGELYSLAGELKNEPSEPKLDGLMTRLQWTSEAVSSWQDMLAFRAGGYDKQAEALRSKGASFVAGKEDFTGPRNVVATLNADGSLDVTWENLPGTEGEITIQDFDQNGNYFPIATAPAGSTSCHIPSGNEKKPPRPRPGGP